MKYKKVILISLLVFLGIYFVKDKIDNGKVVDGIQELASREFNQIKSVVLFERGKQEGIELSQDKVDKLQQYINDYKVKKVNRLSDSMTDVVSVPFSIAVYIDETAAFMIYKEYDKVILDFPYRSIYKIDDAMYNDLLKWLKTE